MNKKVTCETPMRNWFIKQTDASAFEIRIAAEENSTWEQWVLWTSDRHWDNPKSDRALQLKHLEQAKERNAIIIDNGDLYCAMQGKYDPRANKSSLRPEHRVDDYLDELVRTGADWFAPYAENIAILGAGNHELSIRDRHETNLTERLVTALRYGNPKAQVMYGGFACWIAFSFRRHDAKSRFTIGRLVARQDHGYGGGGPVTSDIIQHQRRQVYLPDAQIIVTGHTHDFFVQKKSRLNLTDRGKEYIDEMAHLKICGYKQDYDSRGNWATTRGMPPKPIGAAWLRFYVEGRGRASHRQRILFDITKAG